MAMSLKPEHLKRYKDFAWLLFKYGRGDLVKRAGLAELMPAEPNPAANAPVEAEELAAATLLNLDEIGLTLAPRFDPNAAIRRHAAEITEQHLARDFSLGTLFHTAVDLKNFVQHLPGRINRILDRLADNQFQVKVDAIDEARLMEGMQKVANRISLGLVLAALIVGAALLMRVDTPFRLFGYPGLAIVLFLAAVAGGIALAVSVLASDIRAQRKPRRPSS